MGETPEGSAREHQQSFGQLTANLEWPTQHFAMATFEGWLIILRVMFWVRMLCGVPYCRGCLGNFMSFAKSHQQVIKIPLHVSRSTFQSVTDEKTYSRAKSMVKSMFSVIEVLTFAIVKTSTSFKTLDQEMEWEISLPVWAEMPMCLQILVCKFRVVSPRYNAEQSWHVNMFSHL